MTTMLNRGTHFIKLHEWIPLDKVDWNLLSCNPNAIPILEKNLDKVDWCQLSRNPNAIHLLEKNLDKVCWWRLCDNPNAIHILKKKTTWIKCVGGDCLIIQMRFLSWKKTWIN